MNNKIDTLIDYYDKQKQILNLLKESNDLVSKLFSDHEEDVKNDDNTTECHKRVLNKDDIREIIMDSLKPSELASIDKEEYGKWYAIKYHDYNGRRKYIQFNKFNKKLIARPTIVTRTGYSAGHNVIFKRRKSAIEFFVRFMSSDARRDINEYDMESWKIVEVPKRVLDRQQYISHYDAEYGLFYV